jgi:hypothetical protein
MKILNTSHACVSLKFDHDDKFYQTREIIRTKVTYFQLNPKE